MNINNKNTFRELAGVWQRVDSQEPKPQTLADFLNDLQIVIDDYTQFCRIIRYNGRIKKTITYKAYTDAKIVIYVSENKT